MNFIATVLEHLVNTKQYYVEYREILLVAEKLAKTNNLE